MQRWKIYFEELLKENYTDTDNKENESTESESTTIYNEEEGIKEEELRTVIQKLKNGKAPGHDNIKPEQLKYMGEDGEHILLVMLNRIWEMGKIPKDWEKAVILPIYKKGDNRICNNYRGISLLCTTAKIYEAILENKLRKETEGSMEKAQSGFRKGHSTQDHIFTLRNLTKQTIREDSKLFILFIDLEKAFDRVPRQLLWKILKERQIQNQLLKAIKSMYRNTSNYIRTNNEKSEEFITTQGVRQGGALSPLLFIIFMDKILKEVKNKTKKVEIGFYKLRKISIAECAFADDLAILAPTEKHLQHNINIWNEELVKYNMNINIDKTKVMVISNENITTDITINGKRIEQVESFNYLGSILDNQGNLELEINNRILAANKNYFSIHKIILNNKLISKKTKMTLYKTMYRPILIYGSETWVMNQRNKSKIQAAEMKYLRKVEGISKIDRVRNDETRAVLQIDKVQNTIEKKQLAWYGHLIRMPEDSQTKILWMSRKSKKKKRGRPHKTWENIVDEILNRNSITRDDARRIAMNRKKWKDLINEIR